MPTKRLSDIEPTENTYAIDIFLKTLLTIQEKAFYVIVWIDNVTQHGPTSHLM